MQQIIITQLEEERHYKERMDQMPASKLFLTELYPRVEYNLTIPKNSNELQDHIRKYIDRNNEVLFDKAPLKRLYFRDTDRDIFTKATDITSKEVLEVLRKDKIVDSSLVMVNKPFFVLSILAARYYAEHKKERELYQTLTYIALALYSSIHFKYFPYEPNENIMNYAINHLSNKYDIKKYGTMFKLIYETIKGIKEKYADDLKSGEDLELIGYISNIRTRLNSKIQNIADEYYKARDFGLYLNTEKESSEEDSFHQVDNISFQINKIADKAVNKILTGGIDEKALNVSAENNNVSVSAVRTALYNIISKKGPDIRDFVVLILQSYLVDEQKPIDSISHKLFVYSCIEVYSKSNTVNPTIINMKKILDKWLTECSDKYIKTERIATKSNFRRAIFFYFVFMIQRSYADR